MSCSTLIPEAVLQQGVTLTEGFKKLTWVLLVP